MAEETSVETPKQPPKGMRPMPVPQPGGTQPGAPAGSKPLSSLPAGMPAPKPAAPAPVGAGANGAPDAPEENVPRLNFFQLPWVQNILPFVTSLTLHATVIVVAILTIQAIKIIKQPTEEQIIIPESTMAEEGPPGGVPNVGLGGDPFKQAAQDKTPDGGTPDGWAEKKGESKELAAVGGGSGDSADTIIAVGAGNGFGNGKGIGSGTGNGAGSGTGDGSGALAMFGTPGGGGIGPKGPVFGNGGNARLISFVCDASGSMINKMASLKNELGKAVQGLRPIQAFGIIFFQDEKFTSLNAQLLAATPENKRKAEKFLEDVTTTGQTNPIPGIELAFKQKPQLIYILTDGDFPDNKAVEGRIKELNKDKKVKINTIAFITATDTDTEFLTLLQSIAKDNGGVFRKVSEDKLDN